MHTLSVVGVSALALVHSCSAFAPGAALPSRSAATSCSVSMKYVPDGLTAQQWADIQAKEKAALKNLGKVGTTKFKSRSFQAWQEAMENGEGGHLFPVDPRKVKTGEVKLSEVPYMQRGGSWDDDDLLGKEKGIKKKAWSKNDTLYANGGERASQSINIFGGGSNLPWIGRSGYKDPVAIDPIKEQAKWDRAKSPLPPNKMALARIEKEKAKLAAAQAKKEKQLAPQVEESKRFFFF